MGKKQKLEFELSHLSRQIEEEQQIMSEEEEEEEDPEEFEEEVVEYGEEFEGEEAEEVVEYVEEEDDEEEEEGNEKESDGKEEVESDNAKHHYDEEPIQSVISAFGKEALIILLSEAAERHPDVAARVKASADLDPSQRNIFVHGLNWDTTSEMLSEEFQKYVEIEDCRLITDKATGRSKGYGFILFKSGRGARQALKEPQKVISNRITSCQLASVGPVAAPLPQKQQPSEYTQRKIYVSNVRAALDPVKLKDFFSKYCEIEERPLGLDKETGKPKGFCLFVSKTVESAKWALMEPHKQFEGLTLHCQRAIDGPKSQKTQIIQSIKNHKNVIMNQQFVDNVAPPLAQRQQQLLSVNPAALGQALTTFMAAQVAGLNLLGALGAVGVGTGLVHYPGVVPDLVVRLCKVWDRWWDKHGRDGRVWKSRCVSDQAEGTTRCWQIKGRSQVLTWMMDQ